ncbi:helix-turn-helix transcriptional regulator [Clostridium saccharobutylicum]|uniref:Serine/threonine-protein kinase PknK n=1 Tax=Clostridium saccharobutylicum TaxID=169679 RepID=A0A1S8MY45_CLOSA|nr:LuxR C-terminal-related transcriptional regulator [Clostridium saccharobutylicum]OOM09107.1 serine/threonine-protein kinase PknK [Clostridium saccharobutylicum]
MKIFHDFFKNINSEFTIDRKMLNEKIENAIILNKIIFVFAPIGWGKTIAISHYANKFLKNIVWYNFDEEDNNRSVLRHLIEQRKNTKLNIKRYIIFDNFDLIRDNALLEGICNFIDTCSKNYKFIIISRKKIPPCFSRFIIRNEINIINKDDLAFNNKEIKEFYLKNEISLRDSDIKKIFIHTDGWPICIKIGLINLKLDKNETIDDIFEDNEYIEDFLNRSIWNRCSENAKRIFLIASLFEEISLEQCIEITGEIRSEEFLNLLLSMNKDKYYRFNPIVLQFIRKKYDKISSEEIIKSYKKGGKWFEKNELYLDAANAYYNAGDIENETNNLERFCNIPSSVTKFSLVKHYIMRLPSEIINNSITLCSVMAIFEIIYYNPDVAKIWYEKLLNMKRNALQYKKQNANDGIDKKYKEIIKNINEKKIYICIGLPQISNYNLVHMFCYMHKRRNSSSGKIIKNISITGNLPTIIRGIRDISEILNNYDFHKKNKMNLILEDVLGEYSIGLVDFACAEVEYEKNKLNDSLINFTREITKYNDSAHIDILYIGYILLEKTMCASGYIKDANIVLDSLEKIVKDRNALYLMNNIKAVYTRMYLLKGDVDKAKEWLKNYLNKAERKFNLLGMYEYFTKARIYIATKQYGKAICYLEILYTLNKSYNNKINIAECCILQAIALNRDNHKEEALKKIDEAINICEPYKYIRIFADEGEASYEILNQYYKNVKLHSNLSLEYFKELLNESRKFGEMYPEYLKKDTEIRNVKLTKSEIAVLKLINKGMSNSEISDYLNITKDTVKFHIKNIYSKLGVRNRLKAVQYAKKVGMFE